MFSRIARIGRQIPERHDLAVASSLARHAHPPYRTGAPAPRRRARENLCRLARHPEPARRWQAGSAVDAICVVAAVRPDRIAADAIHVMHQPRATHVACLAQTRAGRRNAARRACGAERQPERRHGTNAERQAQPAHEPPARVRRAQRSRQLIESFTRHVPPSPSSTSRRSAQLRPARNRAFHRQYTEHCAGRTNAPTGVGTLRGNRRGHLPRRPPAA